MDRLKEHQRQLDAAFKNACEALGLAPYSPIIEVFNAAGFTAEAFKAQTKLIAQLEREVEKAPRWISTADKLPPLGLVYPCWFVNAADETRLCFATLTSIAPVIFSDSVRMFTDDPVYGECVAWFDLPSPPAH